MREAKLHQLAAYCYAKTVLETQNGTNSIEVEELENLIGEPITREDYDKLVGTIYKDYGDKILDVNEEGEDDYHFNELKDIDLNIGTWFYLNNEESEEE